MPLTVTDKIFKEFSKYPKRSYPKGQILLFSNEEPKCVYYLVKGRIRMYDVSYRGDDVIINVFKPYSFVALSGFITKNPNKYFFKTETLTEVHEIPSEVILDYLKTNPDVLFDLLSRIYRGLDGYFDRVVQLMSGTAKSLLSNELVIETNRFGKKNPDGSFLIDSKEADIAARSGLTRETVSREMKKLKDKDWVQFSKEGLIIKNLEALKKNAES
jgi:CRP-like cAMP-binding protein